MAMQPEISILQRNMYVSAYYLKLRARNAGLPKTSVAIIVTQLPRQVRAANYSVYTFGAIKHIPSEGKLVGRHLGARHQ